MALTRVVIGTALAAVTATVIAAAPTAAQAQLQAHAHHKAGSGDFSNLGRAVSLRQNAMVAANATGLVAVIAHLRDHPVSPLSRRLPSGTWQRRTTQTGEPAAVVVSDSGTTTVIGVLGTRVLATIWPRLSPQPHTETLMRFPSCDRPDCHRVRVASNDEGDLAIMAEFDAGGLDEDFPANEVTILRQKAGQPWSKPVTYPYSNRAGRLRAIDLDPHGQVWGAFEHQVTLETRPFLLDTGKLGDPTLVSDQWTQGARHSYVAMSIGAGGDRAFTRGFTVEGTSFIDEDGILTVMPADGVTWSHTWSDTHNRTFPEGGLQVSPDGSVTLDISSQWIERWDASTGDLDPTVLPFQELQDPEPVFSPNGTAFTGTTDWAVGDAPSAAMVLPVGRVQAMAVNDRGIGYLAMRPVVNGQLSNVIRVYRHLF